MCAYYSRNKERADQGAKKTLNYSAKDKDDSRLKDGACICMTGYPYHNETSVCAHIIHILFVVRPDTSGIIYSLNNCAFILHSCTLAGDLRRMRAIC